MLYYYIILLLLMLPEDGSSNIIFFSILQFYNVTIIQSLLKLLCTFAVNNADWKLVPLKNKNNLWKKGSKREEYKRRKQALLQLIETYFT